MPWPRQALATDGRSRDECRIWDFEFRICRGAGDTPLTGCGVSPLSLLSFQIRNSKSQIPNLQTEFVMGFVKRALNPVWQEIRFRSFRAFSRLAYKLPVRFSYWVGTVVGDFIYLTWKRHAANAVS